MDKNKILYYSPEDLKIVYFYDKLSDIFINNGGSLVNRSIGSTTQFISLKKEKITLNLQDRFLKENNYLKIKEIAGKTFINPKNYQSLVHNGYYYYIETDDYGIFKTQFLKRPTFIKDGNLAFYSGYIDNKVDLLLDENLNGGKYCIFSDYGQKDLDVFAERMYLFLTRSSETEQYFSEEKRLVSNTFNDGYHYEKIKKDHISYIRPYNKF